MTNFYNVYLESKLDKEERNKLSPSDFGLPETREFPIPDKTHIMKAIQMFKYCAKDKQETLKRNIVKKAKELGVNIDNWSQHKNESNGFLKFFNENYSEIILSEDSFNNLEFEQPEIQLLNPDNDEYKTLTVMDKSNIIGYASKNKKTGFLSSIKVKPNYQKQGIGTMLLADIDADKMMVSKKEDKLKKFFEKRKYEVFHETQKYYYLKKRKI